MRVIYIAHPISGNVVLNCAKVQCIARDIYRDEPGTVPLAPYLLACAILDDDDPEDRARGIECNHFVLRSGIVDELRIYGDRVSPGMVEEVALARVYGIEVVAMTEATKAWLSLNTQSLNYAD